MTPTYRIVDGVAVHEKGVVHLGNGDYVSAEALAEAIEKFKQRGGTLPKAIPKYEHVSMGTGPIYLQGPMTLYTGLLYRARQDYATPISWSLWQGSPVQELEFRILDIPVNYDNHRDSVILLTNKGNYEETFGEADETSEEG